MAPYLLPLFDDAGMCKPQKSAIYDCFETVNIDIDDINATYIIDGGYLLHCVVCDHEETLSHILDK